jgi:hemerythrin-like domain-containing protein
MVEPEPTPPVADVSAYVLAEHRRLRELTHDLEAVADLHQLLLRVGEFRAALVTHFLDEEAVGGLYDTIRGMAPRQIGRLDQLQREHAQLLAQVDGLAAAARACLEGPVAQVLEQARALARRVRAHEAAEDDVLLDTLYTDLGQGD